MKRKENLAGVDIHSAVLTGVVDLDDAIAKVGGYRLRNHFHEA